MAKMETKKPLKMGSDVACFTDVGKSLKRTEPENLNRVSSVYPSTQKRVENTTSSGVFLTKGEIFG